MRRPETTAARFALLLACGLSLFWLALPDGTTPALTDATPTPAAAARTPHHTPALRSPDPIPSAAAPGRGDPDPTTPT